VSLALQDATDYRAAMLTGLRPDPDESFPDWCDEHIELPAGLHSEHGKWRTSRTPYLREIMECLSPHHMAEEVVVMKGAQLGLTQVGVQWIAGYVPARAPGPGLMVEPTVDLAKKVSRMRIKPLHERTPALKGKIRDARSRDSGNTTLMKEYDGGVLVITGANSGVGLRFMSARYLFLDEEDAYPADVDGEGEPSDLADNRLSAFSRTKKLRASTPLEELTSVIEPAFLAGSRAKYLVPCPSCLKTQELIWWQIVWPGPDKEGLLFAEKELPQNAAYRCQYCQVLIPEAKKTWMLEHGSWVHADPTNPIQSFHISSLYAPYGWKKVSWGALAKQFISAARKAEQGDTRKLKTFWNTKLALTWKEKRQEIKASALSSHRVDYAADVPAGAIVLTAAVDVQDDRLEAELVGWGVGEESWSIDYQQWMGSPAQQESWLKLDQWLKRTWTHESGIAMVIQCALIDSGGHHTQKVYDFVRPRQGRRIYAIKGAKEAGSPLIRRGGLINHVQLYLVGTITAKDLLFAGFQVVDHGPGYCHFPMKPAYDEEYFAQLTGEAKKDKYRRGILLGTEYVKIRARNEALDLRVYNRAALALLNPNWKKLAGPVGTKAGGEPSNEKQPSAPRRIPSPFVG
jgi:phage terminase large subunit GpA-like protein